MNKSKAQFSIPRVGVLESGPSDTIADIEGVKVGHFTLANESLQTGVTVIKAHGESHWLNKVPAGATIFNGYGKSVGLMQVEELGVLESPIALTNTFSVSAIAHGQIQQAIAEHPQIGKEWTSVNPLVFECSDAKLNDMQALAIKPEHFEDALQSATSVFAQGSVGAGRGMSCYGMKGGVGSASRKARGSLSYRVGALVLSNFGRPHQIQLPYGASGETIAAHLEQLAMQRLQQTEHASRTLGGVSQAELGPDHGPERGSIIIVLATDAPLDARQLKRLSMRAVAGLARTGSMIGHGSGDIALAFSTAYTLPHHAQQSMPKIQLLHEQDLDGLFEAAADATQQAIWASLWNAETVYGRDGSVRYSVQEVLAQLSLGA
jgi:D-aminopeptidase